MKPRITADESSSGSDLKPTAAKEPASTQEETPAHRSRAKTTERILDAAEELFSRRDPCGVTVRQIAQRAGVTHALVHQYVGTKDDIMTAVVLRAAPRRQQVISEFADYRAVWQPLVSDVMARRVHTRAVLRSAMDGVEYASLQDRIDTGRMLVDLARKAASENRSRASAPDAMDPRIVVAAAVSLTYGWVGLKDWLLQICDLEDEDPAEVEAQLESIASYLAELVFTPEGESPAV
jgi:AcrR family transcriptional regulator